MSIFGKYFSEASSKHVLNPDTFIESRKILHEFAVFPHINTTFSN